MFFSLSYFQYITFFNYCQDVDHKETRKRALFVARPDDDEEVGIIGKKRADF